PEFYDLLQPNQPVNHIPNNNPQPIQRIQSNQIIFDHFQLVRHHIQNNNFCSQSNNLQLPQSNQFNDFPQSNQLPNNNLQHIQSIQQNNNDFSQPNQLIYDQNHFQNNRNSFQSQPSQNNVHPNQFQLQIDQVKIYFNTILDELGNHQFSK
ncbi:13426_t:CDS:1, partial [Racocetra persica]